MNRSTGEYDGKNPDNPAYKGKDKTQSIADQYLPHSTARGSTDTHCPAQNLGTVVKVWVE